MLGINREGSPFQVVEQYFSPNKSLIGQLLGESDNATTDLLLRRLCQFNALNVVQDAWPGLSRYVRWGRLPICPFPFRTLAFKDVWRRGVHKA